MVGEHAHKLDTHAVFTGQMLVLGDLQGSVAEVAPAVQRLAEESPGVLFWRAAKAFVAAELGRETDARREFEALAAAGFRQTPKNFLWLGSIAYLSKTCVLLNDVRRAEELYALLRPYEHRFVTVSSAWPQGAVSGFMARLAMVMKDSTNAERLFKIAIDHSAKARADAFASELQRLHANFLGEEAADERRDVPDLAAALSPAKATGGPAVFHKTGDYWTITYEGETCYFKDSVGLRLIARLLRTPQVEVHALELTGLASAGAEDPTASAAVAGELTASSLHANGVGAGEQFLDSRAKIAYRRRLEDLREELREATAFNDSGRKQRAEEESEFLGRELARATGLGGRDRKAASWPERARVNVTRRIKAAIAKIAEQHSSLGRYLATTIKTGTFCCYEPDPRISVIWDIEV